MIKINNKQVIKIVLNNEIVDKIYINGSYRYLRKAKFAYDNGLHFYSWSTPSSAWETTSNIAVSYSTSNIYARYLPTGNTADIGSSLGDSANHTLGNHIIMASTGRSSNSGAPIKGTFSVSAIESGVNISPSNQSLLNQYLPSGLSMCFINGTTSGTISMIPDSSNSYGYGYVDIRTDLPFYIADTYNDRVGVDISGWTPSSSETSIQRSVTGLSKGYYLVACSSRYREVTNGWSTVILNAKTGTNYRYLIKEGVDSNPNYVRCGIGNNYKTVLSYLLIEVLEDNTTIEFKQTHLTNGTTSYPQYSYYQYSYGYVVYKLSIDDTVTSYKTLEVFDDMTSISASQFANRNICNIILPNTLTSVGANAFNGSKAYSIIYNGTVAQYNAHMVGWDSGWSNGMQLVSIQCTDGNTTPPV